LQTESVTYIVQRAESLVGLFYLLTLYCVIRSASGSWWWYAAAVAACALGMASKEIMVSAPLIVLLYDRAFLAGSFREAWRRRWGLYVALASTWLLLIPLVLSTSSRAGSAGFGVEMSHWAYLCTQFGAIVHYLRLSFWPDSLVFYYGTGLAHGVMEIVPYAIVVGLLGIATCVALWRWPKAGFLGAWFFAILAPTSSIVPVATQTMAEHRMYLPLAAVVTSAVLGGYFAGRRLIDRGVVSLPTARLTGGCLAALIVIVFVTLTLQRNTNYASALSIWQDTVDKTPDNARARVNLGFELVATGQFEHALSVYREALKIEPDLAEAESGLGRALVKVNRPEEAIAHFQKALLLKTDLAEAHYNLGTAFAAAGRVDEAIAEYRQALAVKPNYADPYNNLGVALGNRGQTDEAIGYFQKAVELKPDYVEAYNNLGGSLVHCGRWSEAIVCFQRALKLKPDYGIARCNLGSALAIQGRYQDAISQYRQALRLNPQLASVYHKLAQLLATCPDASVRNGVEAVALAQQAAKLTAGREPAILDTLAAAYAETGRFRDAAETARQAMELATQQNQPALAKSIQARLRLYEAGAPVGHK
jgi:tetratricopeptide (TPR) repeat protein